MNTENLEEIVRKNLDAQYTLCEVVLSDAQRTVFRVTSNAEPGRQLALIVDHSEEAEPNAGRYREARFLSHSNLLGISATGLFEDSSGSEEFPVSYIFTTCPDEILTARLQPYTSALGVMLQASKHILAGLEYLHSENLVYCSLWAGSVWRVGDQWKLSDYSQLRVPGVETPENSRRLLIQRGVTAPPEVYFGQITPAWDVWSFGAMLGRISSPVRRRNTSESETIDALVLPPEIEEMLANCSAPDPGSRPSVSELKRFFEKQEEKFLARLPELPSPPKTSIAEPARFRPITVPREREVQIATKSKRGLRRILWPRLLPFLAIFLLVALILIGRKPVSAKKTGNLQQSTSLAATPALHSSPGTTAQPLPPVQDPSEQNGSDQESKTQINAVLQQWASATRHRNVADEVSCYGPVVDTYYGRHHLTSVELEQEKQRAFSEIGTVRRFDMDQVKFDHLGPGWAVVSFNKHWEFGNPGGYAGTAREQLVLREFGEEWKITSERELKVFAVRNRG